MAASLLEVEISGLRVYHQLMDHRPSTTGLSPSSLVGVRMVMLVMVVLVVEVVVVVVLVLVVRWGNRQQGQGRRLPALLGGAAHDDSGSTTSTAGQAV